MLILYFQSRASNIGKPVLCLLYNQAVSSNDCIIANKQTDILKMKIKSK